MSALFEDNFEIYGGDIEKTIDGVWAATNGEFTGNIALEIPSFEENGRYWLAPTGRGDALRAVFTGGAQTQVGWFQRLRFEELPGRSDRAYPFALIDADLDTIFRMKVNASGYVSIHNADDTQLAITTTPVIVAGRTQKIQAQVVVSGTGTCEIRVDGVTVINATGLSLGVTPAAGFTIAQSESSAGPYGPYWVKDVALYSLSGTYNNSWPDIAGVATVVVNADTAVANMTPRYRKMFGDATLYIPGNDAMVAADTDTEFNLGTADYTLEGTFRFNQVPEGGNFATLMGVWREFNSKRSYRLRLNGPSEEAGGLQFEVSTDGEIGTVNVLHDVQWEPIIGHDYHIAVVRSSAENSLYIDGVRQGVPVADAFDYFAATTQFGLGGEFSGSGTAVLDDSSLDGFVDEVRITPGVARYTANFAAPTAPFPRSIVDGDASFASVVLLAGFEEGILDESDFDNSLTAYGTAERYLPQDGDAAYQTLGTLEPFDDRYLEAALIPSSNVLTLTDLPANGETVTLGDSTYTFNTVLGGAGSVLIGADISETIENLEAAINSGDDEGTVYGTGTVINASASAIALTPTTSDLTVQALIAGTVGNTIASTETMTNGSWASATLLGGLNLPGASKFGLSNLPNTATGVRWVAARHRSDIDVGAADMVQTFSVSGVDAVGATQALTTLGKTYYTDRFEEDPNTASGLTPTSIVNGELTLERTT